MKKTALLIINYNDSKTTIKLLEKIKTFSNIDLVLVLDNNSSDNSYELLKKEESNNVEVIKTENNLGYGGAINYGASKILEKYPNVSIIISNPDIEIDSSTDINYLIENFNDDKVAVVAPVVIEDDKLSRGWKNPSPFYEGLCNLPLISRYFRNKLKYRDSHYNKETTIVDVVNGCFFIVDGDLFKEELFDPKMFLYYEENVLDKKVKKLNKVSIIDNRVKIKHNHSVTISKNFNRLKKLQAQKTSQYYFHVNYNKTNIITKAWLKFTIGLAILSMKIRSK